MDDSSLKDKFSFHCIVKYFLFASNAILWVSNLTNANKLAKIVSNHFHNYQQLKTGKDWKDYRDEVISYLMYMASRVTTPIEKINDHRSQSMAIHSSRF